MEIRTVLKSDLTKPVKVKNLDGNLFSQDNGANVIYVEVTDNGEPVTLTGGIQGYVVRGDGYTVTVTGSVENGKAKVVLNEACYRVLGAISIVVKAGTTTIGACQGYVYRSSTDSIVDPENIVPSLSELLAQIDNCRQATEDANDAADAANEAAESLEGLTTTTTTGSTTGAVVSKDSQDGHYNIGFTFPVVLPTFGTPVTLSPGSDVALEVDTDPPNSQLAPKLTFKIPRGDSGTITNASGMTIPISENDTTKIKTYIDNLSGADIPISGSDSTKVKTYVDAQVATLNGRRGIALTISFTGTGDQVLTVSGMTANHYLVAYQFYDANDALTGDILADFTWETGTNGVEIWIDEVYAEGSMVLVFADAEDLTPGGGS